MANITAESLEKLQALLEARTVPCPGPHTETLSWSNLFDYTTHKLEASCFHDCGEGRLADPIFAPLLALVRKKCPRYDAVSRYTPGVGLTLQACQAQQEYCRSGQDDCKGSGYITRTAYWQAAPEEALTGAIIATALAAPEDSWLAEWIDGEFSEPNNWYRVFDGRRSLVNRLIAALERKP